MTLAAERGWVRCWRWQGAVSVVDCRFSLCYPYNICVLGRSILHILQKMVSVTQGQWPDGDLREVAFDNWGVSV